MPLEHVEPGDRDATKLEETKCHLQSHPCYSDTVILSDTILLIPQLSSIEKFNPIVSSHSIPLASLKTPLSSVHPTWIL